MHTELTWADPRVSAASVRGPRAEAADPLLDEHRRRPIHGERVACRRRVAGDGRERPGIGPVHRVRRGRPGESRDAVGGA